MILEVSCDGVWTLSFGLSQFHGHGSWLVCEVALLRAGLHYGGEGLRSVKNAWPRHGYVRQMVDVPEKN